jgi:uncharacterized protein (TIGR02145 family)
VHFYIKASRCASGTNNPCPLGYRLPTEAELNNERLSWTQAPISSTNNGAGAFTSPLKLTLTGYRNRSNGTILDAGTFGYYSSSTVSDNNIRTLFFNISNTNSNMSAYQRAFGFAVRCIKN